MIQPQSPARPGSGHQSPDITFAKIIVTIGPACCDVEAVSRMIELGARVFRINFSHGTDEHFAHALDVVRHSSERTGIPAGVIGDISGPKLRIGPVVDGGVELAAGDLIQIQRQPADDGETKACGRAAVFTCTFPDLINDIYPGHRLLINDGSIRTLVLERNGHGPEQHILCRVIEGGPVVSGKGINLPDSHLSIPGLTQHDQRCIDWAIEHELDFLALSFVRKADDVHRLKRAASQKQELGKPVIPVIAKIEQPEAVEQLDAIVEAADGVMVARGDLGVEMDLTQVPVIQKRVIATCHDYGKPVIVATQMLQSMIEHATPTRAEVSDVANAIFDGADAVMLSGETAVGAYPSRAVWMMARIARTAQEHLPAYSALSRSHAQGPPKKLQESRFRTAALAHGVAVMVRDLGAKLVWTWSEGGGGARYLSKNRLPVPIIAASSDPKALRRMALLFSVVPIHMAVPPDAQTMIRNLDKLSIEHGWAKAGDPVVVATGDPIGVPGLTNEILIHHVGDVCRVDPDEEGSR